jgi:hypothetical protein
LLFTIEKFIGDCILFPISILAPSDKIFNLFSVLILHHMERIGDLIMDIPLPHYRWVIDDLCLVGQLSSIHCSRILNPQGCASGKAPLALGAVNIPATSEPLSFQPLAGLWCTAAGLMFVVVMVFRWAKFVFVAVESHL